MDWKKKEIEKQVSFESLEIAEAKKPADVLLNFYEALGWDREKYILNPIKVRTTKEIFNTLYDKICEFIPDREAVGMFMVNVGPGTNENISPSQIILLKGWIKEETDEYIHSTDDLEIVPYGNINPLTIKINGQTRDNLIKILEERDFDINDNDLFFELYKDPDEYISTSFYCGNKKVFDFSVPLRDCKKLRELYNKHVEVVK